MSGREGGEGIWGMDFIYLHETDDTSCDCFKWGGEGVRGEKMGAV
jgi:hypothetical protein